MSYLKVSEAFCHICRGVLIEPVSLPCLHVFCFTCFEESMQETSYSCPLCRRRISNWVRTAKKMKKLINLELWEKIKEQFKEEVRCKLRGEDDGLDERLNEECPTTITISKPGEVAKEFTKLMSEYQSERQKAKDEEELASKVFISKLTEEENNEMQSLTETYQLKLKEDEELARKLQEEINKEIPSSSQNRLSNEEDKPKPIRGPMDYFLKGNTDLKKRNGLRLFLNDKLSNRCASSDSTDSIQSEMHHFKPIKVVPRTPPKRYPDGKILEISVTKVKPLKLSSTPNRLNSSSSSKNSIVESKKIHSPYSAFIGKGMPNCRGVDGNEFPRKRLLASGNEDPDNGVLKEITLGENSDSNSMGPMDVDFKMSQSDCLKKGRNSPPLILSRSTCLMKKSIQKLYRFDSTENQSMEENENSKAAPQFETQDYLSPEPDIEEKLVEEQRRIEQLILQEKADRELALKLSKEWEGRYELRNKPKLKNQMAMKKRSNRQENNKIQRTLINSLHRTRSMTNK